jgi:excisionase family DNA binding protein
MIFKPNNCINSLRTNPPRVLRIEEAARYLTVSVRKLRSEISSGSLRASRSGRRVLIRLKDLEEYLDERSKW